MEKRVQSGVEGKSRIDDNRARDTLSCAWNERSLLDWRFRETLRSETARLEFRFLARRWWWWWCIRLACLDYFYIYYNSALARPFSRYLQKKDEQITTLSFLSFRPSSHLLSANRILANFTRFMSRAWLIFPSLEMLSRD